MTTTARGVQPPTSPYRHSGEQPTSVPTHSSNGAAALRLFAADAMHPDNPTGAPGTTTLPPLPPDPLTVAPTPSALSVEDTQKLAHGKPVYWYGDSGKDGRATFRVKASSEKVMACIRHFDKYADWVDGVKECALVARGGVGNQDDYVHFKVGKLGFYYSYDVRQHFPTGKSWARWTMDATKPSDLKSTDGYWLVTPVANEQGVCQVEYYINTTVEGLPGFVRDWILSNGLKEATRWVKKQAERTA